MNEELEILNWNDLRSKLKSQYPALTSADLQWRHGNTEDLLEMIAVKLGISLKELQKIIQQLP